MNRILSSCPNILIARPMVPYLTSTRSASGKWRADRGLPPRHASPGPLADLPDWSYVDGRGPCPLNLGQKTRYLRDQRFTHEVIKYVDQMNKAKELVQDEIAVEGSRRKY